MKQWKEHKNGKNLVGWCCWIHGLHPCRGGRPNECPGYDIKLSNGEVQALEIWGMSSTPSMPLLPGQLWPEVGAPDRVLSVDQIELFDI